MALDLDAIGQEIGPLTKEYDWKDLRVSSIKAI